MENDTFLDSTMPNQGANFNFVFRGFGQGQRGQPGGGFNPFGDFSNFGFGSDTTQNAVNISFQDSARGNSSVKYMWLVSPWRKQVRKWENPHKPTFEFGGHAILAGMSWNYV